MLGAKLRPNLEGWFIKEGKAYIKINSQGLRDREHSKSKPPNLFRIAVLGDSYAEARQVSMESTFWAIMENKLQGCQKFNGKGVEVINFGVSGYGTDRELLTFRHKVWDYGPDMVLLAFLTGNDIRDNSSQLDPKDKLPFFYYQNGELILDDSFNKSEYYLTRQKWHFKFLYWSYNQFRILQFVYKIKTLLNRRKESEKYSPYREPFLDDKVYLVPEDAAWKEAWRITEGLLRLMHHEVSQKGVQFEVVTLTNGIQVHPDKTFREEFKKILGVDHLFYPDFRIKELGENENFPVLNLAPEFQSYAEKNHAYLHGFGHTLGKGHWNPEGHRLAGERIADHICRQP